VRVRVREGGRKGGVAGAAGCSQGPGGVLEQEKGKGEGRRREEGEKERRKEKGKGGKEKRKEKERLGKRKEMGKREREKERVSAPVAAATVAGRPRAREIRALREKGIVSALIAADDRARVAGLRAARNGTAIKFSVGQKGLGLGFRRRVVFNGNTLARDLIW
jgi:hypothetical protein